MYQIFTTARFEKDVKRCNKRNYKITLLEEALMQLQATGSLPVGKFKTHKLCGNFVHHWEAHLKPDWLIIWLIDEAAKTITLVRTGTHADLF